MVTPSPLSAAAPQWADQIQRLSALLETITYRLLEVEERLTALEEGLDPASTPDTLAQEQDLAAQLEATTQRLARMEQALGELETAHALEVLRPESSSGRRLQVLASPAGWPAADSPEPELDPFFEDGEQAFMDDSPIDSEDTDDCLDGHDDDPEADLGDGRERRIA